MRCADPVRYVATLLLTNKRPMLSHSHQALGILAYKPRASSENALNTTPSANIASCDTVAASHTPIAAFIICQKPSSAEAAPAFSPNGESARAVASGLTTPMPSRNTHIAPRNGKKVGLIIEMSRIAMLLAAVAHRPAWIGRSSP